LLKAHKINLVNKKCYGNSAQELQKSKRLMHYIQANHQTFAVENSDLGSISLNFRCQYFCTFLHLTSVFTVIFVSSAGTISQPSLSTNGVL